MVYLLAPQVRSLLYPGQLVVIDDLNGTAGAAELSFLLVILRGPNRLALGNRSGALCAVIISRMNVRYLISSPETGAL